MAHTGPASQFLDCPAACRSGNCEHKPGRTGLADRSRRPRLSTVQPLWPATWRIVESKQLLLLGLPVVTTLNGFAAARSHLLRLLRMGQQILNAPRNTVAVTWIDQQPATSVLDNLAPEGKIRRNDRHTRAHIFEQFHRKSVDKIRHSMQRHKTHTCATEQRCHFAAAE